MEVLLTNDHLRKGPGRKTKSKKKIHKQFCKIFMLCAVLIENHFLCTLGLVGIVDIAASSLYIAKDLANVGSVAVTRLMNIF